MKFSSSAVPGMLALASAVALPSIAALLAYGIIETPDSPGYLAYAEQIRTGTIPTGIALLHSVAGRISLYRIGGFPALLAMLQTLFPGGWKLALVALQIAAQSGVAVACYATARKLGAAYNFALAGALLPSIGFAAVMNICVLTDALNAAAVSGAALALILAPNWRGALFAGLCLAFATSFREATIYLVLAYLPLALLTQRRLLCAALILLPAWGVAAGQIGWNVSRGAGPVLTTCKQLVMVQALLPLIHDHVPVYAIDPVFAAAAAQTIDIGGYSRIDAFEDALYAQGYTSPQIAAEASHDYALAWRHYPLRMLGATLGDFRKNYLFMPFQPQETVATLEVYTTGQRPVSNRMNVLWSELRGGSITALGWIILNVVCQIAGTLISMVGLIAPWRLRGAWRLRALWCVPVCLVALYMPVHLEIRYLTPAVPIICVLAAVGATRWMSALNPRRKPASHRSGAKYDPAAPPQ
jgi:hypothetical protein